MERVLISWRVTLQLSHEPHYCSWLFSQLWSVITLWLIPNSLLVLLSFICGITPDWSRCREREFLGNILYMTDSLIVVKPTVSNHWKKLIALSPLWEISHLASSSLDSPVDLILWWSTAGPCPLLIYWFTLSFPDPPVCLILSWSTSGSHSLVIHHWTLSFVDLPVYLVLSWSTNVPYPLLIHQCASSCLDSPVDLILSWSTTGPCPLLIYRFTSSFPDPPVCLILSWFTSGSHSLVIHHWTLSFVDLPVDLVLSWSTSVPHPLLIHQWTSFSRDPPLDLVLCWSTSLPCPFLIYQCASSSRDSPVDLILFWSTDELRCLLIHHWTSCPFDPPVHLVLSWSMNVPCPLLIQWWTSSSFDPVMNLVVIWSSDGPHPFWSSGGPCPLLIHQQTSSFLEAPVDLLDPPMELIISSSTNWLQREEASLRSHRLSVQHQHSNCVTCAWSQRHAVCNGFSQNWWKVVSSCLLQYRPIYVINFDKLRRKMLKSRSLVLFLGFVQLFFGHLRAWCHVRMRLFLFPLLLRFHKKLFYWLFYYCNLSTYDQSVTTTAMGLQSTLNRLFGCLFSWYDVIACKSKQIIGCTLSDAFF